MIKGAPTRVTLLLWLVFWFIAINLFRLWTAFAWRRQLAEFTLTGPVYIGASGLIWVAFGIYVVWAFWKGKIWTRHLIIGTALVYTAWYWTDRLLLKQPGANWPFILAVNVLVIIFILIALRSSFFSERGL